MLEEVRWIVTDTSGITGDTIVYLTHKRQEWLKGWYISCAWDMPELFGMKDELQAGYFGGERMAIR